MTDPVDAAADTLLLCLFPNARWSDDYPETWEPEEHVSPDLIRLWEEQQQVCTAACWPAAGLAGWRECSAACC